MGFLVQRCNFQAKVRLKRPLLLNSFQSSGSSSDYPWRVIASWQWGWSRSPQIVKKICCLHESACGTSEKDPTVFKNCTRESSRSGLQREKAVGGSKFSRWGRKTFPAPPPRSSVLRQHCDRVGSRESSRDDYSSIRGWVDAQNTFLWLQWMLHNVPPLLKFPRLWFVELGLCSIIPSWGCGFPGGRWYRS